MKAASRRAYAFSKKQIFDWRDSISADSFRVKVSPVRRASSLSHRHFNPCGYGFSTVTKMSDDLRWPRPFLGLPLAHSPSAPARPAQIIALNFRRRAFRSRCMPESSFTPRAASARQMSGSRSSASGNSEASHSASLIAMSEARKLENLLKRQKGDAGFYRTTGLPARQVHNPATAGSSVQILSALRF